MSCESIGSLALWLIILSADSANTIFASVSKKAQLPLTSKAGGLWEGAGLSPHVRCFIVKNSAPA